MEANKIQLIIDLLKQIDQSTLEKESQEVELTEDEKEQIKILTKRFNWTAFVLIIAIVSSVLILCTLIGIELHELKYQQIILVTVFSGLLGSSTSALISVMERYSFGFEFNDGKKYPKSKNLSRFNKRMNPFFYSRPVLGISTAFLIFTAIKSGVLNLNDSIEGIILFCTIGSFFSKTLIERSRETIKSLKI